MADHWLQRLNDPQGGRTSLIHAIDGLGAIENPDASEPLARLIRDDSSSTGIRLAAARSLGLIQPSGLHGQAADLIGKPQPDPISDLLAVALLQRLSDAEAVSSLKTLAARNNTVVQSAALGRLFDIDPDLLLEFTDDAITSQDVNVRRLIAEALISNKQTTRIAPLCTLLDDVNPGLRRKVAAALVSLAEIADLRAEVITQVMGVLDQDAWRGCEQATIVLVNLDHKPAADRLVDLMSHDRGEVMITAGWGLRRLGLKKHLPAMLSQATSIYDGFRDGRLTARTPGPEPLIAQLFMAFGQMRYRPADELIRLYLPKDFSLGDNSRSAAAWAIGYLYEGESPEDLTKILVERLNDVEGDFPESENVRQMSAISLGRIKAESAVPELRKYARNNSGAVSQACHWAIEQMTGEPQPLPSTPPPLTYNDWFLAPLPDDPPGQ